MLSIGNIVCKVCWRLDYGCPEKSYQKSAVAVPDADIEQLSPPGSKLAREQDQQVRCDLPGCKWIALTDKAETDLAHDIKTCQPDHLLMT